MDLQMEYNKEEVREKYKDLFEYSLDLIYVIDLKGNFLDANEIALIAFGYEREEILNINMKDLLDEHGLLVAVGNIKEMITTGKQLKASEYKLKIKDGDFIYVQTYGIPLKRNGKLYAIFGIATNITERKLAEHKAIESERNYRSLFEKSPYFIGILDFKGNLIECNNAINNILTKHTRKDLLGKNISEIFSLNVDNKHLTGKFKQLFKDTINGKTVKNFEFELKRSLGETVWLNLNTSLMNVENESFIQFIIQNITEKKLADQKLRESERKYRHLFEETPFAAILFNVDGVIVDCNPTTTKLLGYEREELVGRNYKNTSIIHSKYENIIDSLFLNFFKGKHQHRINLEMYRKDNSPIWVETRGAVVKIGNRDYMQLLLYDISKRRKAEILIKEQVKKLQELEKMRSNLIVRISHELKTPLIPVYSGPDLLLSLHGDELGVNAKEIIKMIKKGGERLKILVNRLLDISKLEYNKLKLEKKRNNLSKILNECIRDMIYETQTKNLTIKLHIPEEFSFEFDSIRIEQVFTNLISNAIKNTPQNGKIVIKLQEKDEWAVITVTDTGIGFTKDEMEILFTRFGKIERYGQGIGEEYLDIQGSGLGLFISKEIVQLHGGIIRADSPGRNKGSTFIVELPMK